MRTAALPVDKNSEIVLRTLRKHKAMPLLELSSLAGLADSELKKIVAKLKKEHLVKVSNEKDPFEAIVTLDGRFW